MEFKGTKREWSINEVNEHSTYIRHIKAGKVYIGNTHGRVVNDDEHCTDEEMICNAKLIAAAPELLEALLSFVQDFEGDFVMADGRIVDNPDSMLRENYHTFKKVINKALN